jgi:hypothetical protein
VPKVIEPVSAHGRKEKARALPIVSDEPTAVELYDAALSRM